MAMYFYQAMINSCCVTEFSWDTQHTHTHMHMHNSRAHGMHMYTHTYTILLTTEREPRTFQNDDLTNVHFGETTAAPLISLLLL